MRKVFVISMSLALGLAALLAAPAVAAKPFECTGVISNQTISGDVTVPPNEDCYIERATVEGDVKVGRDADLYVYNNDIDPTRIKGDVRLAEGAYLGALIIYYDSSDMDIVIDGDVRAGADTRVHLDGFSGPPSLPDLEIKGDVTVDQADSLDTFAAIVGGHMQAEGVGFLSAHLNDIGGNLKFESGDQVYVRHNTVGGKCQGQDNVVVDSHSNVVTGKVRGQCNCVSGC
mgnify:CR=1 FL=1